MRLTHVLSLAQSALAQDSEAEIPRGSFIISFLMNALRSHPNSERLIILVYNLLTIISSQGEYAGLLPFLSALKVQGQNRGIPQERGRRGARSQDGIAILFSALNGSHGHYLKAEDSSQASNGWLIGQVKTS